MHNKTELLLLEHLNESLEEQAEIQNDDKVSKDNKIFALGATLTLAYLADEADLLDKTESESIKAFAIERLEFFKL